MTKSYRSLSVYLLAVLVTVALSSAASAQTTELKHFVDDTEAEVLAQFGRKNNGVDEPLIEFRTFQTMFNNSDSDPGRGTIRLLDPEKNRSMEMGYYRWGAGIFSGQMFEFWTNGLSVRSMSNTASFLGVRDLYDLKDIRLEHNGTDGIVTTTGLAPGGIIIRPEQRDVTIEAPNAVNISAGNGKINVSSPDGDVSIVANERTVATFGDDGSVRFNGNIYIAEQQAPMGRWQNVPYNSADFATSGTTGASWMVNQSDIATFGYSQTGDMVTLSFVIALSTVSGSPRQLTVRLPNGLTAAAQVESFCHASDDHRNYIVVPCLVAAGEKVVRVYRPSYSVTPTNISSWPNTSDRTSVRGTLTFPVVRQGASSFAMPLEMSSSFVPE